MMEINYDNILSAVKDFKAVPRPILVAIEQQLRECVYDADPYTLLYITGDQINLALCLRYYRIFGYLTMS